MSNKPLAALRALLVIVVSLAPAAMVQAVAPDDSEQRLRVGLVLGGGGARGAAHIGVLKELERQRIPIDVIAGTSMGAIVGGLYASGMSADDIEQLAASLDWAAALSDMPQREDLSFRRKQDDAQFPIDFEAGLRGAEFVLPRGVVQGQNLDLLLRKLTLHVSHIDDFDALPIPFRAVASDIERGEGYVIGKGDLARAIRASMSVPGAIAPVVVDGRLLVDGGLMGNLPIDVMQGMGVDVIIAVDVEFPLYSREELYSALQISEQVLTILIRKETLRQIDTLDDDDVLIRPELGVFASTDFGNIVQAMGPGEDAARAQSDKLESIALDEEAYAAYRAERSALREEPGEVAFVRVVHDGVLAPEVLESRLEVSAGDKVDANALAGDADRLYGLELYQRVGYALVQEDGRTGVEYRATTKSWGPNVLQFGVSLEEDFEGSTGFNIASRLTRAGLNRLGAEWRTDLRLGSDPELFTEFYQPLSFDSRWFVAPRLELGQSNLNAFAMNDTVARYRVSEAEAGFDFGRELGNVGEFRVGAFRGAGEARVKIGDPAIPNIDFDQGGVFALFRYDSLDDAQFPRQGTRAELRWALSRPGLGADNEFDTVEGDIARTWSRGKNSLQLGLEYATTLQSDNTVQDFFTLGGFLRLSGLERGAISGPHAALARIVYYRRVGETTGGILDTPIYLGLSAESGNVWQSRSEMSLDSTLFAGSLFAGIDTYIGRVSLAAGFAQGGRKNVYLSIGTPPR